jgi:hypothetical protein
VRSACSMNSTQWIVPNAKAAWDKLDHETVRAIGQVAHPRSRSRPQLPTLPSTWPRHSRWDPMGFTIRPSLPR